MPEPRSSDPAGEGSKLKVFVSYSREDADFANELVPGLELCGFDAYLDKEDIAPGEPWESRLGRLIRDADTVVFVLSPNSIRSKHCMWEVTETVRLSKRLLPIVRRHVPDDEVPEQLRRLNYIFFTDDRSFTKCLAELVGALRTDLDWIREHTRLAELAASWDGRGKPESLLLRGGEIEDAKAWQEGRPKHAPQITVQQQAFLDASIRAAQEAQERDAALRRWAKGGVIAAGVIFVVGAAAVAAPKLYAEYVRRTALACDLYAADPDNNAHVPGVERDKIVPDLAVPACREAVAKDPNNPRLLDNLGRALESAGRYEEAAQWYRKAIANNSITARNNLGVNTLLRKGVPFDFSAGIQLIREAASQQNADAIKNYQIDLSKLVLAKPDRILIVQKALVRSGDLKQADANGDWGPSSESALSAFKASNGIESKGMTPEVLDKLMVVDDLSAAFKNKPNRSIEANENP
jgi:TPR repeat protein